MIDDKAPEVPTATAGRFVRYVVGFGVAVGAGMAPFLGRIAVPGFTAMLDLLPLSVQGVAIPCSAFLMGVTAFLVQFFAGERPSRGWLRALVVGSATACCGLLLCLLILYSNYVVAIPVEDSRVARFVVSSSRTVGCRCDEQRRMSDEECIAQLSFNPAALATCYDQRTVKKASLMLALTYTALLTAFAAGVAAVVLQPQRRVRTNRSAVAP